MRGQGGRAEVGERREEEGRRREEERKRGGKREERPEREGLFNNQLFDKSLILILGFLFDS